MKKKAIKAKLEKTKKKLVKTKSKLTKTVSELEAVKKKASKPVVAAKKASPLKKIAKKPVKKRSPVVRSRKVVLADLLPDPIETPIEVATDSGEPETASISATNGSSQYADLSPGTSLIMGN